MFKKIDLGGRPLAVFERGAGRTVLFVHGFPLCHRMWEAQLADLAADFRVIAPDLRGFGESPLMDAEVLSMGDHADDLAFLLDKLGVKGKVVLCGLSMGGYIAWAFWRKYADRLEALVLCDTIATPDTIPAATLRETNAARVLAEGTDFFVEEMLKKVLCRTTLEDRPAVVELMDEMMRATPAETIAAALRGLARRPDSSDLLPHIDLPVLVVAGSDDGLTTPEKMKAMADALPRATFFEVPDAGHMSPLERPDVVNPALRKFLKDLSKTPAGGRSS